MSTVTEEVCPSCGSFVTKLLSDTGWCLNCSELIILKGGAKYCERCGKKTDDSSHTKCRSCRRDFWLTEHANEIERYMADGYSFKISCDLVRIHNSRPAQCLRCGAFIKKAPNGRTFFCTKPLCRKAQNRLKWLRYNHKKSLEAALKTVLEELEVNKGADSSRAHLHPRKEIGGATAHT